MKPTFYFFDYETFGKDPKIDRPSQFAGIRTDLDFRETDCALKMYCQPAVDYLPDPESCLITGITPRLATEKGVNENKFIRRILDEFSQPYTCFLGYNNIRFDDEVTRFTLYRNLYDPYAHEWQNGNSRWDLLDVTRAFYALRPQGIHWPTDEDGLPSFQLESLSKANGLQHEHAHDALSDVRALIDLAQRLKKAQPKLFDYLYKHRSKKSIKALLTQQARKPLVHVSGMFGARQGCVSWVYPIAGHPRQTNAVISIDLSQDCSTLLRYDAQTIREALFTPKDQRSPQTAMVPIKLIHINKCPILAPAGALNAERAQQFGLNQHLCMTRFEQLQAATDLKQKLIDVFDQPFNHTTSDVEQSLYNAFFGPNDQKKLNRLHQLSPSQLIETPVRFDDQRLDILFTRYKARNHFDLLDETQQQQWLHHCQEKIAQQQPLFFQKIENLLLNLDPQHDQHKTDILKDLCAYYGC